MKAWGDRLGGIVAPMLGGGVLLSAAWLVGRISSEGLPNGAGRALLALTAAGMVFVGITRWRLGLYCFLVWLVFEDLPRKFLGNDMFVYFGKDLLVTGVYIGFFLEWRRGVLRSFRPPFLVPLLFFAGLCFAQVLNPNSPSLLYGALGLKLYLYYIPLVLLGYALADTPGSIRRFLAFNLTIAAVVAVIGVLQGVVSPDILNPATTPEHLNLMRLVRRAPLTGDLVPRPTSVFVSDGRFASYMLMTLFLALGLVGYTSGRRDRYRGLVVAVLVLVLLAIALIGSRGAVVLATGSILVFVAALTWGMRGRWRLRNAVQRTIGRISLGVGGMLLTAAVLFPQAVGARWAFYYQTVAPWSPASELMYRVQEYPIAEFLKAFTYRGWPLGYGIGTASLGGQYLASAFDVSGTGAVVESGYGALVLEMGIPGLLTWLAWTIAVVWSAWKVVASLRGSELFPLGLALFWFAFMLLFPLTYGSLAAYQNFILNAYFWILLGVHFGLPRLREFEASRVAVRSLS